MAFFAILLRISSWLKGAILKGTNSERPRLPVAQPMGAGFGSNNRRTVKRAPLPGSKKPVKAPEKEAQKTKIKSPAKTVAPKKAEAKETEAKRKIPKALAKAPLLPSDALALKASPGFSFFRDKKTSGLLHSRVDLPLFLERVESTYAQNSLTEDAMAFDALEPAELNIFLSSAKKASLNEAAHIELSGSTEKSLDQFGLALDSPQVNLESIYTNVAAAFLGAIYESEPFVEDEKNLTVKGDLLKATKETLSEIDRDINKAIKSGSSKFGVKEHLRDNARKLSALAFTITNLLYFNEYFDSEAAVENAQHLLGRALSKLALLADINSSFSETFKERRVTGIRKSVSLTALERKPLNIFDISAFERMELGFIDFINEQKYYLSFKSKLKALPKEERKLVAGAKKNLDLLGKPGDSFKFTDIAKARYQALASLRTLLRAFSLAKEQLSDDAIAAYFDEVDVEIQNWIAKIYASNSTLAELNAADRALEFLSLRASKQKGLDLDSLEQYIAEMIAAPTQKNSSELLKDHLIPKFNEISKKIIVDLKAKA